MNFPRATAFALDTAMCAMMFALQRRHKRHAASRLEIEEYIAACEGMTRDGYFAAPAVDDEERSTLKWPSPIATAFPANDRTHIDLFPCPAGQSAPTVLMLHALMSASDRGYRRWAAVLNARGCGEFGLWASSYGGWIGALLLSVGSDFRWAALMEPIADVGHAIWNSPTGTAMRRELRRTEIGPGLLARLFPLVSPSHAAPLCENGRVIFCAGEYDRIARAGDIARLHEKWRGSELLHVAQGHFGYRMMPAVWSRLGERGFDRLSLAASLADRPRCPRPAPLTAILDKAFAARLRRL